MFQNITGKNVMFQNQRGNKRQINCFFDQQATSKISTVSINHLNMNRFSSVSFFLFWFPVIAHLLFHLQFLSFFFSPLVSSCFPPLIQLLQGEESLLNLMMENSMQSTWKTPQLGRKPRGSNKPRTRGHPQSSTPTQAQTLLSGAAASAACSPSTAKSLWTSVAEEKSSHGMGRKGERSRGSSKALHHHLHHHQTRSSDLHSDPPPQPPISKMDSCHISEDPGRWDRIHTGNGVASGAGSGFSVSSSPPPASSPEVTAADTGSILRGGGPRLRLSRQGKSRGRSFSGGGSITGLESADLPLAGKDTSLLDAAETDGYFSDGEQSDTDTRSGGRKLRLPQLHSGNEDLLRRSVLAS